MQVALGGGQSFVVGFYDVFQGANAGGAFGAFTAGAGCIDFGDAAFFTAVAHMLDCVFV